MRASHRVLEAPPYRAISLDLAKLWCRVEDDVTTEDALIRLLIQAAEERAEGMTGRAFVKRRLEVQFDEFPDEGEAIELPFAPLLSVEYIEYIDEGGAVVTLSGSPSEFLVDTTSLPGRIAPLPNTEWPATQERVAAVRVGITCGYEPVGSPQDEAAYQDGLPALLKNWMEVRIASFYENRESIITGTIVVQPPRDFVDGLLDGLRVNKMFA